MDPMGYLGIFGIFAPLSFLRFFHKKWDKTGPVEAESFSRFLKRSSDVSNDFAHMGPWGRWAPRIHRNHPHNSKEIPKQKLLVVRVRGPIFQGNLWVRSSENVGKGFHVIVPRRGSI